MTTINVTHDVNGSIQPVQGSDNRFNTSSRSDSRSYYNSRDKQEAYSLVWDMTETNSGDIVLYWKNTDTQGRHLVIDSVGLNSLVNAQFKLITVTGTGTGTTIIPSNLNRAAPRVAAATTLGGSVNTGVTGLTEDVVIDHAGVSAFGHDEFRLDDRLRIGQGGALAIECELIASEGRTFGVVFGYYE